MREQVTELIEHFSVESVLLVDVGGDLIGIGTESDLRSPLADALALASLAHLPVPVRVAVAGPGLDGELSAAYVRSRCLMLGGELIGRLDGSDVEPCLPALAQHPSEATTLLAAAALGVVGRAEIREQMRRSLEDYWSRTSGPGITLATFRRLSEVMKLTHHDPHLIRSLVGSRAHTHLALCYTTTDRL
jgi:hypothetical protein